MLHLGCGLVQEIAYSRDRFFGWGAKIGEKQSRQSHSKYNFLQYVYFSEKIYAVYCVQWGLGQSPLEAGNFRELLCLK